MDNLLSKTREICQMLEIKPARSKGQNFLINENIYNDIVKSANLKSTDLVLEIGPGLGFLTMKLAKLVKKVVAVELDDQLADYLQTGIKSADISNVEIVNSDILKFNLVKLNGQKYKVVANLPYNITSIFLRQFLGGENKPEELILMLQKEVAERIVAAPPKMNLLAISVQYYGEPKIIREVKAGNFWPEPQVASAVIKIEVFNCYSRSITDDKNFFRLLKFSFSAKRKMLKNNLAAGLKISPKIIETALRENNFNPKARAEELNVSDFKKLFAALGEFVV